MAHALRYQGKLRAAVAACQRALTVAEAGQALAAQQMLDELTAAVPSGGTCMHLESSSCVWVGGHMLGQMLAPIGHNAIV
jgi:hypothetical protein